MVASCGLRRFVSSTQTLSTFSRNISTFDRTIHTKRTANLSRDDSATTHESMFQLSTRSKSSVQPQIPKLHHNEFRTINLSAGPSVVDENVLVEVQRNLLNYHNMGMGMMEMSHRDPGGPVQNAITNATNLMRELLNVPSNYHVLWMTGGAHAQFAATILNCLGEKKQIDVVDSGFWANRFVNTEALRRCDVNVVWSGQSTGYKTLSTSADWQYSHDSAFIHMCMNETINGVEVFEDPSLPEDAPFISCDATSTLLSRPVDISKYGIIYASSGKNLGPAGVTSVIVRDDLLGMASNECPSVLNYSEQAVTEPIPSLFNTPPTFLLYMVSEVLQEYKRIGGLDVLEANAKAKSAMIYDAIDQSDGFFINSVNPKHRSRMNVPFSILHGTAPELEAAFIKYGAQNSIEQLFAHPLFPGLRVTMYNALPMHAVSHVADTMYAFAAQHNIRLHPKTSTTTSRIGTRSSSSSSLASDSD